MSFRNTNWALAALAIIFAVSVILPEFKFPSWLGGGSSFALAGSMIGWAMQRTTRAATEDAARYRPSSVIDAKRANEQIKLVANSMNVVALAAIGFYVIQGLPSATTADRILTALVLVLALSVHVDARRLMGMLKDESPSAYGPS